VWDPEDGGSNFLVTSIAYAVSRKEAALCYCREQGCVMQTRGSDMHLRPKHVVMYRYVLSSAASWSWYWQPWEGGSVRLCGCVCDRSDINLLWCKALNGRLMNLNRKCFERGCHGELSFTLFFLILPVCSKYRCTIGWPGGNSSDLHVAETRIEFRVCYDPDRSP
jgi:hypothetical protein